MHTIRVTKQMAQRILQYLEQAGIVEFDDTITIEDLIKIVDN